MKHLSAASFYFCPNIFLKYSKSICGNQSYRLSFHQSPFWCSELPSNAGIPYGGVASTTTLPWKPELHLVENTTLWGIMHLKKSKPLWYTYIHQGLLTLSHPQLDGARKFLWLPAAADLNGLFLARQINWWQPDLPGSSSVSYVRSVNHKNNQGKQKYVHKTACIGI